VLRLLGYGNTNRQVSETLHISEKTVEAHRANIKRKLGARGLSDLVRYAISTGLVDPREPLKNG
jgi:two-component system response regulator NreC